MAVKHIHYKTAFLHFTITIYIPVLTYHYTTGLQCLKIIQSVVKVYLQTVIFNFNLTSVVANVIYLKLNEIFKYLIVVEVHS